MINIEVIKDLGMAKDIWNLLSPQENIYDLWDFRYCFYTSDPQPLYFLVAKDDGRPVALLPLQYNQGLKCYEFFAENFMENNRPFFAPGFEYLLPELFNQKFDKTVKIFDLDGGDEFTEALPLEDYIYYIDIANFKNFNDYLLKAFATGRKRSHFKKMLSPSDHEIKVILNDFDDLQLVMDLNVKRFGEESYLRTKIERQPFYDLLKLPLDWQLTTIIIDGIKRAGSLSVIYRGTYYYLVGGWDLSIPNILKYLTKANLEIAINNKLKIFNCSLGDCSWKSFWHMDKLPQYNFIKLIK